jgi:hypothetical protein
MICCTSATLQVYLCQVRDIGCGLEITKSSATTWVHHSWNSSVLSLAPMIHADEHTLQVLASVEVLLLLEQEGITD